MNPTLMISADWFVTLLDVACAVFGWAIVVRGCCIAAKMDRHTDHRNRVAVVLLTLGAFGVAMRPFYPGAEWTWLVFAVGVTAWVLADKRRDYS
jgi:hypothetical protein